MQLDAEKLRFILGLKLKQFRQKRGLSLKELAQRSGVSVSFISEIEKGKKYPKPEKIMKFAQALDTSFDELVSLKVDPELDAVTALIESPFLREFPFDIFGITPRDLVELMTTSPNKAGAFLRTFLEIGQTYDMRVEHFLLAALRSYQKMHQNYFEEIEDAVDRFVREQRWRVGEAVTFDALKTLFTEKYGFVLEENTFEEFPALQGFRSVWIDGEPAKLIVNGKLLPNQKAFLLGRELGYSYLDLQERAKTSSWIKVESFEQVLNNFKASYFAGALLISREMLVHDLAGILKKKRWDGTAFLNLLQKYDATPEMFLYRLSQLIPRFFGLHEIFYVRFSHAVGSDNFQMTKDLNMSRVPVPYRIGLNEHYCRRWLSISLLKTLDQNKTGAPLETQIAIQRSRFVESEVEFLTITLARPLSLSPGSHSSICLGFLVDEDLKKVVGFCDDPAIPRLDVNETCERCGLAASACTDRVAEPTLYVRKQNQLILENTLQDFLQEMEGRA